MIDPSKEVTMGVRLIASRFARVLDKLFGGRLKPAYITALSLAGHGVVAWALISSRPIVASAAIIFFGLMDSLDGALARVQKSSSLMGMYFDAVSDRIKEVVIYCSLIVFTTNFDTGVQPWMVVAVCGSSLLVSYVKAKGEMAMAGHRKNAQNLNKEFSDGFGRYEIRMFLLIVGLLTASLKPVLGLMFAINSLTVAMRFIYIGGELTKIDNKSK